MKLKIFKSLNAYDGLHSAVYTSYIIALSPIITILLGLFAHCVVGDYSALGSMTKQVYKFAIAFPILFLVLDLYPIIIKERKFNGVKSTLKNHPELFILLAFLIWNTVATLLQMKIFGHSRAYTSRIQPQGVQEGLFAFFVYGLCTLTAFWVKDEKIIKNVLFVFLSTAFIISFIALIDPKSNFVIHSIRTSTWPSIFINSNHFSYYLTLATLLSAMGIVLSKVKWKKILSYVFFVFFSIIMLIVDTFGSNLAVFFTLVLIPLILWWFKKKFDYKTLLPLAIFSALTFVVMFFAKSLNQNCMNFFHQIGNLVKEFFVVTADPTSQEAAHAGTDRWSLWMEAFEVIQDSPIIGNGNVLLRPHNEYLQFAQVWGIPSLVIYLSAFVVIFVKAIKNRTHLSNLTLALLFVVCGFIVSAIFGNTMPHTTPFFALFLGFLIRSMTNKKNDATT